MTAAIESASLVGILEKQLRLLRELTSDLVACRTAYVSMDLEAIYQHVATQAALCDQLRQLEDERRLVWQAACLASGVDPNQCDLATLIGKLERGISARVREVVTELALAEGELRHINRAHMVLVDGSRRTLGILANVLASFAPTYTRPANVADANPALRTGTAHGANR